MEYRSVTDLDRDIRNNLHRLPADIELVVGVPRSGMLAASLVALMLNLPLADVDGYAQGRVLASGTTRRRQALDVDAASARHVLVVDDSIDTGTSMLRARQALHGLGSRRTFCAVYGTQGVADDCLVLETVPKPRIFEWNLMHHKFLERMALDIDGILCVDPTRAQNDDGVGYADFLVNAHPLTRPTRKVGSLVTSRLAKYRAPTEAWMARNGVEYGELAMLDLPDAETRRRLGSHARFKARHYRRSDAVLFVESECRQAREIARMSGKDVLCYEEQVIHRPQPGSAPVLLGRIKRNRRRLLHTVLHTSPHQLAEEVRGLARAYRHG